MPTRGTPPAIRRYPAASAFLAAATPFLVEREAEHNLIFGIASNVRREEAMGRAVLPPPYLATAERDGRIVGAAIMTPPRHAVLSCLDDPQAVAAFVDDLGRFDPPTPGVSATPEIARDFADAWCPPRALTPRRTFAERIYRLERVLAPTGVPGATRGGWGAGAGAKECRGPTTRRRHGPHPPRGRRFHPRPKWARRPEQPPRRPGCFD